MRLGIRACIIGTMDFLMNTGEAALGDLVVFRIE